VEETARSWGGRQGKWEKKTAFFLTDTVGKPVQKRTKKGRETKPQLPLSGENKRLDTTRPRSGARLSEGEQKKKPPVKDRGVLEKKKSTTNPLSDELAAKKNGGPN